MPAIELLADHHSDLVRNFTCTGGYTEELVAFLQREALAEQEIALSTTFLALSDDGSEIDAYVTLSATSIRMSEGIRRRLRAGPSRPHIPAVMMDYIAVSDGGRRRPGRGFGLQVFQWVKGSVFELNANVGVRVIGLDVRAGNWHAYQRYSSPEWGFPALSLPKNEARGWTARPAPDASRPTRPPELEAER